MLLTLVPGYQIDLIIEEEGKNISQHHSRTSNTSDQCCSSALCTPHYTLVRLHIVSSEHFPHDEHPGAHVSHLGADGNIFSQFCQVRDKFARWRLVSSE